MRLLDLFCKAGGAAEGYNRAGFDEIVGVDIEPQPHYPFTFIQADAMTFPLDGFDAIHASPPCQAHSRGRHIQRGRYQHVSLLESMRERLMAQRTPWIIENVSGAPMGHFVELCGTQFGLHVYRHRQFESSHLLMSPGNCHHPTALMDGYLCVWREGARGRQVGKYGGQYERYPHAAAAAAMGIDWMTVDELGEAIPPAYTEYLGRQLLDMLDMLERQEFQRKLFAVMAAAGAQAVDIN